MNQARKRYSPVTRDLSRHIFAKRPRCKACGAAGLHTTRTIGRDGDAVFRYVKCRKCGERFVLVLN